MKTHKILFRDSFGSSVKSGGIGRDSIDLLQALQKSVQSRPWKYMEILRTGNIWRRRLGTVFFSLFKVRFPILVRSGSIVVLPQVSPIRYLGKDLVQIIRVHDLFPITNPEWFGSNTQRWFRRALADNSHLNFFLCNSEYSEQELLRLFKNIKPEQCFIGYCEVPSLEEKPCGICSACIGNLPKRYLLAVGTVEPRKNYRRLVEALNDLGLDSPSLVIVGRFREDEISKGSFVNDDKLHLLGAICDGSLHKLYGGALAFVSGSLAEGFDIPALEASLRDLPLILSDIPVHREIYGDSATYFNPLDKESMRRALEGGLLDSKSSNHKQLRAHPLSQAMEDILTNIEER